MHNDDASTISKQAVKPSKPAALVAVVVLVLLLMAVGLVKLWLSKPASVTPHQPWQAAADSNETSITQDAEKQSSAITDIGKSSSVANRPVVNNAHTDVGAGLGELLAQGQQLKETNLRTGVQTQASGQALDSQAGAAVNDIVNETSGRMDQRDIVSDTTFDGPIVGMHEKAAMTKEELSNRLAQAKAQVEQAEQYNQLKKIKLNEQIRTQPEEQVSLLRTEINYRVEQWRRAWQAGNSQAYLRFYADDFTPSKSLNINAWREQRLQRVSAKKKIKLALSDFSVSFSNNNLKASARFNQHYESSNFTEVAHKELQLHKKQGQWYITSERQIDE